MHASGAAAGEEKGTAGLLVHAPRAARVQRGEGGDLQCPCGAPIQDSEHLVLERPQYMAQRDRIMQSVHDAAHGDSDLASLIGGHSKASVLAASLGAPLEGPWRQIPDDMGPYSTLVGLAGPLWAEGFSELF